MTWRPAPTPPPISGRTVAAPRAYWEHLDRGADVGVRGIGPTKAAAFEQAALALTGVIADPSAIDGRATVTVTCDADDDEALLLGWLNGLIGEMAARRMLFSRFHVEFLGDRLLGTASGERIEVERHHPAVAVKAATSTGLRVARTPGGEWLAQTVLEI